MFDEPRADLNARKLSKDTMRLSFQWEKTDGKLHGLEVFFIEGSGKEYHLYSSYEDSYGEDPPFTQEYLEKTILKYAKWCEDRGLKVLNNEGNNRALKTSEQRDNENLGYNFLDLQVGLQTQKRIKE